MMDMAQGAVLSPCGVYRYVLARPCGGPLLDGPLLGASVPGHELRKRTVTWCMLNPSVANAEVDDPTIRRVRAFSADAGFWRLLVVNLFAWRATKPEALLSATDAVGPENDEWIQRACENSSMVIAAGGSSQKVKRLVTARAPAVLERLRRAHPVHAMAHSSDGSPRHPLYLAGGLRPALWMEATS